MLMAFLVSPVLGAIPYSHAAVETALRLEDALGQGSTLAVLLNIFLPAAHHIVVEVQVARHLGDTQATLIDQLHSFVLEYGAVLFAFNRSVLCSPCCPLWFSFFFQLSILTGELHFTNAVTCEILPGASVLPEKIRG